MATKLYYPRKFKNEGDVKRAVKFFLAKHNVITMPKELGLRNTGEPWFETNTWYCMPRTGGYGRSGIPDFLCCIKGKFVGIETKFGNNPPSAAQYREGEDIMSCNGAFLVVDEKTVHLLDGFIARTIMEQR